MSPYGREKEQRKLVILNRVDIVISVNRCFVDISVAPSQTYPREAATTSTG
ncbi:MAG: hypothetical protein ACUVTR_07310 [Dehalococcoidia bacterium]